MFHSQRGQAVRDWIYGLEVDIDIPRDTFIPPPALIYLAKQYGCSPCFRPAIDVDRNGQNEWRPNPQDRISISGSVAAQLVSLGNASKTEDRPGAPPQLYIDGPWEAVSDAPSSYVATYPLVFNHSVIEILKRELNENFIHATAELRPSGTTDVTLTVKTRLSSFPAPNGIKPIWKLNPLEHAHILENHPRRPERIGWKLCIGGWLVWGQDMRSHHGSGRNIVARLDGRVGIFQAPQGGGEGIRIGLHHIAQLSPNGGGFVTDLRTLHQVPVKLPVDDGDLNDCCSDDFSVGKNGIYFNKIHLCLRGDGNYICGPIPEGAMCAAEYYKPPWSKQLRQVC
jgi:hypothetical protein